MNSMRLGDRRRGGRVGGIVDALFARVLRKASRFSALIRQRGRHDFFFNRLLMSTACMLPLLIHRSTVSRETCRRSATSWIVSHRKPPSWFPVACMASPALPNWSIHHLARSDLPERLTTVAGCARPARQFFLVALDHGFHALTRGQPPPHSSTARQESHAGPSGAALSQQQAQASTETDCAVRDRFSG